MRIPGWLRELARRKAAQEDFIDIMWAPHNERVISQEELDRLRADLVAALAHRAPVVLSDVPVTGVYDAGIVEREDNSQ
jgi:hypothetical protein